MATSRALPALHSCLTAARRETWKGAPPAPVTLGGSRGLLTADPGHPPSVPGSGNAAKRTSARASTQCQGPASVLSRKGTASPCFSATLAAAASSEKTDPLLASPGPVAFFDVDGTVLKSNVVSAFLTLKLARMSAAEKALWLPLFAFKVLVYLLLDRIDRGLFNRVFYLNYRGFSVADKEAMAGELHQKYVLPRILPEAESHIRDLRSQGFRVVLVTGSLDFLMQPLADLLHCDAVFAARLKEENGRFSGQLDGKAVSAAEKAELAKQYAAEQGVDLRCCHAYGDSIADLAMLEVVGFPHAVRPEARLRRIAMDRGWPVLDWGKTSPTASTNPELPETSPESSEL